MRTELPVSESGKSPRRKWGSVLALGAVLVLFALLLLPPVQAVRKAPQHPCRNSLWQIGIAMFNYEQKYGCFPPAYVADKQGRPMHSWRVLILPFLGAEALYDRYRFDEPWNSPHNLALARGVPHGRDEDYPIFHCPNDRDSDKLDTSYVMVVGPRMISDGTTSTSERDFTDGISNTIMIVEMSDSGIHWMEPRDLKFDEMSFRINDPDRRGIRSKHPGGAIAAFGDGTIHWIEDDLNPELLKGLLTRNGGEDVSEFLNPPDRPH